MALDKYDIFIEVIKNGSLTKTAQKTGYTQSGISHMITALEAEMGVTLLARNHTGISLTPEGEVLLPYISSVSKSRSNLWECARQLTDLQSGTVRIGTLQSISTQILPDTIANFRRDYPGVRFELTTRGHTANIHSVINGTSDFSFTCLHEELDLSELSGCHILPFTREKMVVILSENHPLSGEKYFPVERLQNEQYIMIMDGRSETDLIFKQHHINPDILFYMGDAYSIMAMVEKGIGISIMPEMSTYRNPYDICVKELSVPAYRNISILYRKHPLLSNAARTFMRRLVSSSSGDFTPTCNTNADIPILSTAQSK